MEHSKGHHHHHHHHGVESISSLKSGYYIAIILTISFVVFEILAGIAGNSMGLISDAGHKFVDSISLIMSLVAFKLASSKPTARYTFGFRKASVLIAFANALVLSAAVIAILIESVEKLGSNEVVDGLSVTLTSGVGIVVSVVSALVLMRHRKNDINTRGAFLHLATDALVSVGVLASGLVINATGWYVIDPVVSIVISAVLLCNAVLLIVDSFRMIIDGVPSKFDTNELVKEICALEGVECLEDVRIHAVSVTQTAFCAKVGVKDIQEFPQTAQKIKKYLCDKDITEVVLEPFLIS